jgi:hypothetical protein
VGHCLQTCFLPATNTPPGDWAISRTFLRTTFLHRCHFVPTRLWKWNWQNVPKRWHLNYRRWGTTQKKTYDILKLVIITLRLIHTYHAVPLPCSAAKGLDCVFPIWFTQCGRCHNHAILKVTSQRHSMARHVWISIGCPEMVCGRPARVQLLPANTWSSMKVVIRSIPIR